MATLQTTFGPRKELEGYVKGIPQKRPLAFKPFFGDINTTWQETVMYDVEADKRNLMGQFAKEDVDVYRVQLPNFDTKELSFAYSKEAVGSPDYSEISQRMLGEQPGAITLDSTRLSRAVAANMREQFTLAYERFENLYELSRSRILIYGTFDTTLSTPNGQHHRVVWDLNRKKLVNGSTNNAAERTANENYVNNDIVPEVDLTNLWANTSTAVAGGLSWDGKSGADGSSVTAVNTVHPVEHLNRMLEVAAYRSGTAAIFMSDYAYSWLRADLNSTAYKDAANKNYRIFDPTIDLEIMPYVKEIEGLTLRMMWNGGGGMFVPIYTYNGMYHDRITGVKTRYFPEGYVVLVPPANYGAMRFGKIKHLKARWAAKQFWLNGWMNEKTGVENFEIHTNFVTYHTDIDSCVSWKVCTTKAA